MTQPIYHALLSFLKENPVVHTFFIILTILFCYVNTIEGPFLYDDEIFILNNRYLQDPSLFLKFFYESAGSGAHNHDNFYRPLQLLIYGVIYQIFELDQRAYHFVNILFHCANALLVYKLLQLLFANRSISFFSSLFYGVHPAHTEAIAYINGLAEPLFLFFSLIAIILFQKAKSSWRYYLLSIFSFAAALLAKETAIVLPLALVIIEITQKNLTVKRLIPVIPFFIGSLAFIYLRLAILNFNNSPASILNPYGVVNIYAESIVVRLYTFIFATFEYLKILIFPFDLKYDRVDIIIDSIQPLESKVALAALALFTYLSIRSLNKSRIGFFSFAWAVTYIAPVSFIIPINGTIKEHWLYVPAIGFALAITSLIRRFPKVIRYPAFAIILIAFSYGTIDRNRVWQNEIFFYQSILEHNPQIARIHNNLAKIFDLKGESVSAEAHYKIAIELDDRYPETHHNLGMLYLESGKVQEGIAEFKKALALNENFIHSHIIMEKIHRAMEEHDIADYHAKRIQEITNR